MPIVTVSGYSDDVIDISGDIEDEYNWPKASTEGEVRYVAFSEGTVLRIWLDEHGIWRLWELECGPLSTVTRKPAPIGIDAVYSDEVIIDGPIRWCVIGVSLKGLVNGLAR